MAEDFSQPYKCLIDVSTNPCPELDASRSCIFLSIGYYLI